MGIDERSKGVRIYWPDKQTVSVERNVHYDKTASSILHLKGEDLDGFVKTKMDKPIPQKSKISSKTSSLNIPPSPKPQTPSILLSHFCSDNKQTLNKEETGSKQVRKPTQKLQEIMSRRAVAANLSKSSKTALHGVQMPTNVVDSNPQTSIQSTEAQDQVLEGEG